jgi:hypothetical protein
MFESPQAKRIRRSKVFDSGSSSSSDEEVTETTTIKEIQDSIGLSYHFDYDLIENGAGEVTKFAHLQVDEPENVPIQEKTPQDYEAFEFRLFATPRPPNARPSDIDSKTNETPATQTQQASNKITIRSPTPDVPSSGRFINPNRPKSYYFTTTPPPPSITLSAISGPTILSSSHSPWPGTFLPWRVIHLSSSTTKLPPSKPLYDVPKSQAIRKSRKLSKKRRIQLRTRSKLMDAKVKEKEQHLREKKTRLNRERKVKRREKEKMEKAQKEKEREMEMVGKSVES